MARKTQTVYRSEKRTETVEYETAETVAEDVTVLACDVCGRTVEQEAADTESDDTGPEMHEITRKSDERALARHEGQPDTGMVLNITPGEIHFADVREFRKRLQFYREETSMDQAEYTGIGGGARHRVQTDVATELRSIDLKQGLLVAAGLDRLPGESVTEQSRIQLRDLQVRLDLGDRFQPGNATGKHVCGYCWDELFGGDE